jgi:hypothetical protein
MIDSGDESPQPSNMGRYDNFGFYKMKNSIIVSIFLIITTCSCRQNSITSSTVPPIATNTLKAPLSTAAETPTPESTSKPLPTLIYNWYPIPLPDSKRTSSTPMPTITAPPPRNPPVILPGGLDIEEYEITKKDINTIPSPVYIRHPNAGGWYYWPKGGIINGFLFQAKEENKNHTVEIHATLGDDEIFAEDCSVTPFPTVITAWVYGEHWIIQSVCHQEFNIFWDGVPLNISRGYQSSFAFQILGKKPFYLFKRDDQFWLFYDDEEESLGYEEIKLTYCCDTYDPPQHYENMITFFATRHDKLFYVAIGLFED